MSWLIRESR